MSTHLSAIPDMSPEALRQCLDAWYRSVAAHESFPRRETSLLLDELSRRPEAWTDWRRDPGFPDEMVVHLWTQCLTNVYHATDASTLVPMATSWRAHPEILTGSPVLGTAATALLIEAVEMETDNRQADQKFRTALHAVLDAAPRQAPVRYSTVQLEELIDATAHRPKLSAPFIAVIARHLGTAPEVVRAAWAVRSDTGPRSGGRARVATLLTRAPVAAQQGAPLVGNVWQDDPFAATPWSFYNLIVSTRLEDELIMAGDEGVVRAWAHPSWRSALLAHATAIVLDTGVLWKSRRNIRVALDTMAAHADAWPHDRSDTIYPWEIGVE